MPGNEFYENLWRDYKEGNLDPEATKFVKEAMAFSAMKRALGKEKAFEILYAAKKRGSGKGWHKENSRHSEVQKRGGRTTRLVKTILNSEDYAVRIYHHSQASYPYEITFINRPARIARPWMKGVTVSWGVFKTLAAAEKEAREHAKEFLGER